MPDVFTRDPRPRAHAWGHVPMLHDQFELGDADSDLSDRPSRGSDAVEISAVASGAADGALTRVLTFKVAQDSAISFTPPAPIGVMHLFPLNLALGAVIAAVLSYRADGLGYTELLARRVTAPSGIEVRQLTRLTGTTGTGGKLTCSAHSDGKVYIENRRPGPPLALAVHLISALA